jgi:hypothetical protein
VAAARGHGVRGKENDVITLALRDQTGAEMTVRVRLGVCMGKILEAYCSARGIECDSVRFLYGGLRLPDDQTCKDLGMVDGDVVDVLVTQHGD